MLLAVDVGNTQTMFGLFDGADPGPGHESTLGVIQLGEQLDERRERDPQLESRPTFLFFKGAANGLFAEGAERLLKGVNDQQALLIGIRCERGSHRFFKKYGERFEDSEGKAIFLEFADEEREHLELLIREYRDLLKRSTPAANRRPAHGRRTVS